MPNVKQLTSERMGTIYELSNDSGTIVRLSPEGARLLDWVVPVEEGRDIVVGMTRSKDIAKHVIMAQRSALWREGSQVLALRSTDKNTKRKTMMAAIRFMAVQRAGY